MYDKQILRILLDVGVRGISAKKLAKHVYNHYCTFFYSPDFDEVYRYVQKFLRARSRPSQPLVLHAEKWGHYRLNPKSTSAVRMLVTESDGNDSSGDDDVANTPQKKDLSLSLFDDVE